MQIQNNVPKKLIKEKIITDNTDTELDEKVILLFEIIQKRLISGNPITEVLLSFEDIPINLMEIIFYILSKKSRNLNENYILHTYLMKFKEFQQIFYDKSSKEPFNQKSSELMLRIATFLNHEQYKINKIIFRYGDKADKFYIILNGTVQILLPYEQNFPLCARDYFQTLIKLYLIDESEFYCRAIIVNQTIYRLNEDEFQMLISLYIKFKIINTIEKEKNKELYKYIKKSLTTNKHVVFSDKVEIATIITQKLLGSNILKLITKLEIYLLYKFFSDEFDKLYKGKINYNDIINKNNDTINKFQCIQYDNVEQYVEYVKPIESNSNKYEPEVKMSLYHIVTTLETGETFGDIAFNKLMQKRTATILVNSDKIDLGSISKNVYDYCLKNAKHKMRFSAVKFLLSLPIFKHFSFRIFEQKYFNFFFIEEYSKGTILFHRNEKVNKVYFILEGEVQLFSIMTLTELNKAIQDFGGKEDKKLIEKEHNKLRKDKKIKIRINALKPNEFFGIENYEDESYDNDNYSEYESKRESVRDSYYPFDCEVCSSNLKVFSIAIKFFNFIITKEFIIKEKLREFVSLKKKIILKRLKQIYKLLCLPPLGVSKSQILNLNQNKQTNNTGIQKKMLNSSNSFVRIKSNERSIENKMHCNSLKNMTLNNFENLQIEEQIILKRLKRENLKRKILSQEENKLKANSTFIKKKSADFLKEYGNNRILYSKSFRTKKIIISKEIMLNMKNKTNNKKGNVVNEVKIRYSNNNFPYLTRKEFYEMRNKEDEKFQLLFKKRVNSYSCIPPKEKRDHASYIDMLVVDKWREREFSTDKKQKKVKRNNSIHPLFMKTNYKSTLYLNNNTKHI